jgi:helix-turn-helix protein
VRTLEISLDFYRQREQVLQPDTEEIIIRDHIQWIALEWPSYGYRMITAELARRYKAVPVNHKRVLKIRFMEDAFKRTS